MTKNQIYEMDLLLSKNKGLLSAEEENEYISLLNYAKSNLIEENIVNEEDVVDEFINEDITEELVNEEINEVLDDDSVEDEIEEPENIIETNTSKMFLKLLQLYKKLQILIYDSSENVNSFYLNGIQM
jgi:lipid A disaccharide synthetase